MAFHYARYCFVPGCRSGTRSLRTYNRKNKIKNPSLFSAPKDPKLKQLWDLAICRKDRTLSRKDVVCEIHFKEDEIQRYYETLLANGEIHRLERTHPTLKKNAIPSIFPSLENQSDKRKRGCPVERLSVVLGTQDCDVGVMEPRPESEVKTELFDFQVLKEEAPNIVLPSDMWTVGVLKGNQVIFASWSEGETFEARKRVLVNAELQVKIFFGNVNAALDNMKEVHSLAEVSAFLIVIDQLKICSNKRTSNCLGYAIPSDVTEEETAAAFCRYCQKAEVYSFGLNNGNEDFDPDEVQNKKSMVLADKGVSPEGKPPPKRGVKKRLCGETHAVDSCEMVLGEEEGMMEELSPPPKMYSLTLPLHLLSHPPVDFISSTPSEENEGSEDTALPLNIKELLNVAHHIPMPSDAWTRGVVKGKRLIFASWKEGKVMEAEKRVVVDEDMSVKVVIGNITLALNEIRNVKKFEDVGRYLYIVDKMAKCNGVGTGRRAASCPGYFIPGQVCVMGFCLSRCAFCQGASEELMRIRRMKRGHEQVRAEVQEKAWKNLKKLSDLYPTMKKGAKASAP
ncbi:uncharacterized protein LOC124162805 isoform X2 [Ischnura elegans]|uniref:uncharacterized protein LOC124162805 isoform X2 n=1 Tax=Ischnura elegans TaxID=197161 RepID=UPI001ED8AAB7|nr:uncharacterized protein LOC124162805 isoform X2 [Ischnura elegans]